MLKINFNSNKEEKELNILLLGAHCDDIEIGCGGTILKICKDYKVNKIKWVVFASNKVRKKEAIECAERFLEAIPNKEIIVLEYRDAFLESSKVEIKHFFETIKKDFIPNIIFTHCRNDRHQDHRLISDLTWNTFRNHFILEYEIPKYDGDLGQPNFFTHLDKEIVEKKIKYLLESYQSQKNKHWFDTETFYSIMRIRGIESASLHKYSEAFYSRKIVL